MRMAVTQQAVRHVCNTTSVGRWTHAPSKCGVGTVQMKNWEPLVLGPAFAMLRIPGLVCLTAWHQHKRNKKIWTMHYRQAGQPTATCPKMQMGTHI